MEILKFNSESDTPIEVDINVTPNKKDPNYNAIMKLCEILIITNNNMCVKLAAIEDALTNIRYTASIDPVSLDVPLTMTHKKALLKADVIISEV